MWALFHVSVEVNPTKGGNRITERKKNITSMRETGYECGEVAIDKAFLA